MSNDTTTPESEVNATPEETVNDEQDTEQTIGDTLPETQEEETQQENKVSDHIPKARLDKEIQRRKDLEAELAELREEKDADSTVSNTEKDPDVQVLADKLAKIENAEASAKVAAAIEKGINDALAEAPEYAKVANVDILKQMALANKGMTYSQLLDKVYGNTLEGKRTLETTTPRGGAKDSKVDFERAQRDGEYRKEVLRDPDLKKQYNVGLETRLRL